MLAFLFSIGLFVFWLVLGYAVLSALYTQRNLLQNLLLAPVVGVAVNILPILSFSRLGWPVEKFAWPLLGVFLLFIITLFFWFRPVVPFRKYWPFALVFLLTFILTGRPMFEFGFNWLSYANDDMANYCLGAMHFLHYGYSIPPTVNDLLGGKDYSLHYWFLIIPSMIRMGGELLLSWVSGVSYLMPDRIFMPVIMSLYLTLISAIGALVYKNKLWKNKALFCCLALSCSALTSLGIFYQLIAQVAGLSIFVGLLFLLLRLNIPNYKYSIYRYGLLVAIVAAAFSIFYPEIFPFFALSFLSYFILSFLQKKSVDRKYYYMLGFAIIVFVCLVNSYLINFVQTMLIQTQLGIQKTNLGQVEFPYFLIPNGFAILWNIQAIAEEVRILQLEILLGIIATLWVFITAIRLSWRARYPVAIVTVVMFVMGIFLFINNVGFGLFKLAMYIQPFLFSTVVLGFYDFGKKTWLFALIVLMMICGIHSQKIYMERSKGIELLAVSIPNASKAEVNYKFSQMLKKIPTDKQIISDTENIVLAKFQSLYTRERETYFISRPFFYTYFVMTIQALQNIKLLSLMPEVFDTAKDLRAGVEKKFHKLYFDLHDDHSKVHANSFTEQEINIKKDGYLIDSGESLTVLNRRESNGSKNNSILLTVVPLVNVSNHLVFKSSDLGRYYYLPFSPIVSLYQLESDYFYPDNTMAGVGRQLLFEIINPTKNVRLVLNISSSLNADGDNQLPPAAAVGNKRTLFPIMGRGSARVFSPALTPQMIENYPYVAIDMGSDGKYFKTSRRGLSGLFGKNVLLDNRKIVGFARDISLVSNDDYETLVAPSSVSNFPKDLSNPNLEYSGVYEDGWLSEAAFFRLLQPKDTNYLLIEGNIPKIIKTNPELIVMSNGKKILQKRLNQGDFKLQIPMSPELKTKKIELHFSQWQSLPKPDNRPVAVKLNFIGFVRQ